MKIKLETKYNSKYLQNFSNSSLELYNKGKPLFDEYNNSYPFYYKYSDDFCYKKNPKRFKIGADWWTANGWNVKGRDKYNKINTNISTNSFDNNSKIIYDNFIGKYLPTINNYSSLIEMIDSTVIDSHNKNIQNF